MTPVPSIKGSVFAGVVECVNKLIDAGELGRADLPKWLESGDLALLEASLSISSWYDVRAYDRMNRLLLEVAGEGSPEYLREQGRQTARRLLDAGLYAQLEYLNRTRVAVEREPRARYEAFGRDLRLLTSLSAGILNFTRWTSRPDPEHADRYRIDVTDAADMPESLCWRSDGFINGMAAVHGGRDLWTWARPTRDRVEFRMVRPI
jgi:hypothetical protein